MNIFKTIFGHTASRVWFIVTAIIVVLGIVVNILATTLLYTIVCQFLGRPRAITADGVEQVFVADFDNKEDARKNGESVNEAMTEEGMVLLKNEDGALPLAVGAKVSVFGKNSVNIVTGGSGSAAGGTAYIKNINESLTEAGFVVNPTLWEFYESGPSGSGRPGNPSMNAGSALLSTGETPQSSYTQEVKDSYAEYKDAALIVISRIGGEGWDLPRTMTGMEGAREQDDHYLQLDQNETDLIQAVCAAGFDKVVVLINASSPMELGFLDDPSHYAYNENIDACMWIGVPGDTGIMSLGRLLAGKTADGETLSPSGRLPDTYVRNFKNDPTWQNFGDNPYTNVADKNSSYVYSYVDYEESIYFGYRYYETRALDEDESWYSDNVVFPFGYGLSYTSFEQEIVNKSALAGSAITADGEIEITVRVTNTGDTYAAKDAVQIYVNPPYTEGGIEKSHVMLAGFAKSPLLAPGESADVTITVDPYYIASYDYDDANGNGFSGYELEAGEYHFILGTNAHEAIDSFAMNVSSGITYANDPVTDTPVVNRYDDADDQLGSVLSRSDWEGTYPEPRTEEEKSLDAETNAKINSTETNNPNTYTDFPDQGMPGETDEEGNKLVTFRTLVDKPYDDPLWDDLLDQISVDDMISLFNNGAFSTVAIESIGKPATIDADGPAGFADFMAGSSAAPVYEVAHYCCEPLMAATFNVELLEDFGTAVGNEALVGNQRGDGMPYSGWYAPGINMHRSPFGGRTGEYFSEDPLLTGMLGAYEIRGAMSKGVYTQVKHFAVNEQETNRTGICTWLDEQALREVYLRPFELAVKEGGTIGMMSSFNRIGTMWTGGDYRLLTEILRNEWGFRGMVISDYNTGGPLNPKQMAYAGGDLNLTSMAFYHWSPRKSDPNDMNILRNCAKNILYTVNNSNIMNTDVLGYNLPVWVVVMIIVDCVLAVGLAVWGVFAIRKSVRAEKQAKERA